MVLTCCEDGIEGYEEKRQGSRGLLEGVLADEVLMSDERWEGIGKSNNNHGGRGSGGRVCIRRIPFGQYNILSLWRLGMV